MFNRGFVDCKEQNEFKYDIGQGIIDVKKRTRLLDWWTNDLLKAELCTWKKWHLGSFFEVTIELQYANKIDSVPSQPFILF